MLSPDGVSRVFDEKANGYARSDGCGCIILKRLSDAIKDGDNISGVIVSSRISTDGGLNFFLNLIFFNSFPKIL
jgi:acyl transferase domain-containing protein